MTTLTPTLITTAEFSAKLLKELRAKICGSNDSCLHTDEYYLVFHVELASKPVLHERHRHYEQKAEEIRRILVSLGATKNLSVGYYTRYSGAQVVQGLPESRLVVVTIR